jgi:SAM-dependent methyltransferase
MSDYHGHARTEIVPHLPASPKRLLELGCAAGATVAHLKTLHPNLWAAGVELDMKAAEAARSHLDVVWQGTVEDSRWDSEIPAGSLDVILCLDILEHLVDPWTVVKRLTPLLAPGGKLIISLPNVRNWKFIRKLLFSGDFRYRDAGLLDRTHLRFFTRATGIELATCSGLALETALRAHDWRFPDIRYILSKITAGHADELLAKQWIIVARAIALTKPNYPLQTQQI